MSEKKAGGASRKRLAKVLQEGEWDCSVCTFTNSQEAFKCSMCDVRKGTSTRKPRLNQQIKAQQEATRLVGQLPLSPLSGSPKEEVADVKPKATTQDAKSPKQKLKELDHNNLLQLEVTVNNSTFLFTEFRHKGKEPSDMKKVKSAEKCKE